MTLYAFPVLFDHVSRDSVEDPLDDTGTVQQQLDQVKCLLDSVFPLLIMCSLLSNHIMVLCEVKNLLAPYLSKKKKNSYNIALCMSSEEVGFTS